MCNPLENAKPFKHSVIDVLPNDQIGVYGFWYNKRCIYIGRTTEQSLRKRLFQHYNDCHNDKLKKWIISKKWKLKINYKIYSSKINTKNMEYYYWDLYKPICNKIPPY